MGIGKDFHFIVLSRYISKGPFHIKDSTLNCPDSRLFIKLRQRGYAEILVDIGETAYSGSLWVAYYLGGVWYGSVPAEEIGLCKKCSKSLLDLVQQELKLTEPEIQILIDSNRKLIHEAISSWGVGGSAH